VDDECEEDLKMMRLFGQKGCPPAGNASRHCQRGTKYFDLHFSLSNYLRDGVFDFKPTEISHTAARPFSLHDIGDQSDGGVMISNRRTRNLCNSIKKALTPQLPLDRRHLNSPVWGIGWTTV
jgi:hypothetical protein